MRSILSGTVALLVLAASPAFSEEGQFTTGAGGLAFEGGENIAIVEQDLFVSREAVQLRYVLRNRTPADLTVAIRFPLPDRSDLRDARELRWPSGFRASVDGSTVTLQPRRRALLGDQDHSEMLTGLGVPLSHLDDGYEPVQRALAALPRDVRARLVSLGLIETFEPQGGTPQFTPLWTVRESWQWDQAIPAGRDLVVEYGYRPGLAGTIDVGVNSEAIRNSESGQADIRLYCLDDAFLAGVDRLSGADAQGELPGVAVSWFTFLHGSGPEVGAFRLVVDRGEESAIASFCGEGQRAISPTQVELRRSDWRPQGELRVLFMAPSAN